MEEEDVDGNTKEEKFKEGGRERRVKKGKLKEAGARKEWKR